VEGSVAWVTQASAREPTLAERRKLHRIGEQPIVATLTLADGETLELAARAEDKENLLGPFTLDKSPQRETALTSAGTRAAAQKEQQCTHGFTYES
jgi:hypothetical protein